MLDDRFEDPFESKRQKRQRMINGLNKNHWAAAVAAVAGHMQAREARKQAGEERSALVRAEKRGVAREEARYGYAKQLLEPYIERADVAQEQLMVEMGLAPGEAGTAYMETPGYQAMMQERLKAVGQEQAGMGQAYSGARMQAAGRAGAGVQSQYYANYMNMLQGMASPAIAQNLASLGMGQAATMGASGFGYAKAMGEAGRRGSEAQSAYYADIAKGIASYESQQSRGDDDSWAGKYEGGQTYDAEQDDYWEEDEDYV